LYDHFLRPPPAEQQTADRLSQQLVNMVEHLAAKEEQEEPKPRAKREETLGTKTTAHEE